MKTGLLQKFKEALLSREVRKVLPTDMSSAELESRSRGISPADGINS